MMNQPRLLAAAVALMFTAPALAAEPVKFNRDIRPIMSDTCFACHGPATQKGNLRLDIREQAIKTTKDGITPIVPGKPQESEIIKRIFAEDELDLMPPADSHKTLTKEQKETIKRWVAEGAIYEKHWSFEPPVKAPLPKVDASVKVNNAIDAFIADKLAAKKLKMSPEADRRTLIRRVAFALTGLPPTPAEVDAYLNDKQPNAYEAMVDRYLASPRYGEEMARHWLDLARYADTHGMHLDNERQTWAYRDYVIKSFNDNKPFDRFTVEQVAGDLIPNANTDQVVATGFLRNNITTGEGGSIDAEWQFRYAVERASTVASTWLALTAGCAVCHDHKFDPIPAKDYYSFYAFFYSNADPAMDGNALLTQPTIKLITPQVETKIEEFTRLMGEKQKQIDEAAAKLSYTDPATIEPRGPATTFEIALFDDEFPKGARITNSTGGPTAFVDEKEKVVSGKKAVKRNDTGLGQDVAEGIPAQSIPVNGKFFAHVWIDPKNPPKTLMLQYFKEGWLHRAVWGDYDLIQWGTPNTPERYHVDKKLPETGKWVKLEVEAAKLGFKPGDQITGFAFTQYDGTVYWDKIGISGVSDPASDPQRSLLAWWKQQTGKDTAGAPADVNNLVKAGFEKTKPTAEQEKKVRDYYLQAVCVDTKPTLAPLHAELAALKQQRDAASNSVPSSFIFRDIPNPRQAFVMMRGDYTKPGEKVEPNTPAALPPLRKADPTKRATRLDLANWLIAPENPLTARVAVNRFWQQFFGTGLSKTGDDFGSQGELPTHPELLDYLAVTYRDGGWNTKELVKMLVTSAAFRQSSRVTRETYEADPDNRYYARAPRFRLDAEQIRDNALYASGLIDLTMGGKGVKPYQPPNIWEPVGFTGSNTQNYVQDKGSALYRRSIYVFLKRTAPPPFMSNFDAPSREAFCAKRERSNSPLQALQLMNDVQHVEAARNLAQRMLTEGGATPRSRITFAYKTLLAREPDAEEVKIVQEALAQHLKNYEKAPEDAKKLINAGESKPKPELKADELAAYTMVANLLLNLDETVNRN